MNESVLLDKYSWTIYDKYRNVIKRTHNVELLKELYKYIKSISNEFYSEEGMNPAYYQILSDVTYSEQFFEDKYVSDTLPKFDDAGDSFMDYLAHEIRLFLLKRHLVPKFKDNEYLRKEDFTNDCKKASLKAKEICDKNGVKCEVMMIYPGYDIEAELFYNGGFHAFDVVTYKGKDYIFDCTYRQFFNLSDNLIERLGVVNLSGCRPGCFMNMNDRRKKLANTILEKGYAELTEESFKDYLDGFTISFRNGLYYEETGDMSFTTDYTVDDYYKFLTTFDSQVSREGELVLGYQRKPLKQDLF